jgi:hypothetical protein
MEVDNAGPWACLSDAWEPVASAHRFRAAGALLKIASTFGKSERKTIHA